MATTMVVVNVYQLGMSDGVYQEKFKELKKENALMTRDYVEDMMQQVNEAPAWKKTGKLFIIDEEASKEWLVKFEDKQKRMARADEIQRAKTSGVLEDALTKVVEKASKKEPTTEEMELARVRYKELFKKDAHPKSKLSTILSKIEEKESK